MITAIVYIAIFLIVYMVVDVLIFTASGHGPGSVVQRLNELHASDNADAARKATEEAVEDIKEWKEKEFKMEYKSAWTASRIGKALAPIGPKWRGTWPDEMVDEIDELADDMGKSIPRYIETLARAVVVAILLALVIRTFVIQAFKIPSGSMIPTLQVGDQLLVTKFSYGLEIPFTHKKILQFREPERGDIVVFKPPRSVMSSWVDHEIRIPFTDKVIYRWSSQVDFIKRIIALPGDTVEMKDGVVYVNGEPYKLRLVGEYEYERSGSSYVRNVHSWEYRETIGGKEHVVLYDTNNLEHKNWGPKTIGKGEFFAMGDNRDDSQDSRAWGDDAAHLEDIRGKALIIHFSWDPVTGRPRFGRMGKILR